MPKCSICIHPNRAAIDKALVAGESLRSVAQRTGTSATALHRHKAAHLSGAIARVEAQHAARIEHHVAEQAERRATDDLDVHTELRRVFHHMTKLLAACDAWLTDPDDPTRYDLNPRGDELKVTYEVQDGEDRHGRPVVKRRKATLAELIAKIETGIPTATALLVETKHADPRKLIVDTANALRPSVELLAKLVGQLDESPKTQINVIEVVR